MSLNLKKFVKEKTVNELTVLNRFTGGEDYFLNFEYLFLNLSIRPAVSTNLDLPV